MDLFLPGCSRHLQKNTDLFRVWCSVLPHIRLLPTPQHLHRSNIFRHTISMHQHNTNYFRHQSLSSSENRGVFLAPVWTGIKAYTGRDSGSALMSLTLLSECWNTPPKRHGTLKSAQLARAISLQNIKQLLPTTGPGANISTTENCDYLYRCHRLLSPPEPPIGQIPSSLVWTSTASATREWILTADSWIPSFYPWTWPGICRWTSSPGN